MKNHIGSCWMNHLRLKSGKDYTSFFGGRYFTFGRATIVLYLATIYRWALSSRCNMALLNWLHNSWTNKFYAYSFECYAQCEHVRFVIFISLQWFSFQSICDCLLYVSLLSCSDQQKVTMLEKRWFINCIGWGDLESWSCKI